MSQENLQGKKNSQNATSDITETVNLKQNVMDKKKTTLPIQQNVSKR